MSNVNAVVIRIFFSVSIQNHAILESFFVDFIFIIKRNLFYKSVEQSTVNIYIFIFIHIYFFYRYISRLHMTNPAINK